ncbi:hypothetical protein A5844_000554 [Enterococcus sp. 10A9_DIV0425]|uniref:Gram-positive cocci surface proteins LPxTG domain-containing protein n=1 Tax=Candidatus Enterococcus wittei TaxID=1987383 RepID=A0A2C9XQ40_9ENTE|nr:hypothetical protein [Enterococcus sp. 10A9_DIV0425]OTP12322.1 hypothetical protein A5844_000554 [Enterococcus sp. 10A9_DIV0425]THE11119.1 hypothetical protein E1H99_08935 [Enterococcus hirae]
MKKFVSSIIVLFTVLLFTVPVDAAGAINANEQRILDLLNEPVRIQDKEFTVPATYITQAENHLKQNDLTDAQVDIAVSGIENVRNLLSAVTIDMSGVNTLDDLIRALPRDVILQIQQEVTRVADALGLVVLSWNLSDIQIGMKNADGSTSLAFSTNSPVKQTGANFASSAIAIASLLLVAAGAVVVGRKTKIA